MKHIVSIDLGTSSVKVAVLAADTLQVIAVSEAEYPIHHRQPEYAEQNPDEWWNATVHATRQALQSVDNPDVVAIGLSGQMHGLVCLGKNLKPVHPAIIWADSRSEKQVQELIQLQQKTSFSLPGYPATGFAASSVLWLKQNAPHVLEKTDKWCLPKDYIRLKLTNVVATDPSDVTSTWLYDVLAEDWATDIYTYCGFTSEQMPQVVNSSEVSGELTQSSADELGLSAGIPVVGGSADLPAQALGYGVQDSDTLLITVGSGGQIFLPTRKPIIEADKPYYVFNHNIAHTWYIQTSILSAGLSLRWLRDFLGLQERDDAYSYLSSLAQKITAGTDGLRFLPYLAGERNPNPEANAHGLIFGLRLDHRPDHFARAIMEGVGFAIKESLSHIPTNASTYVLAGGITHSPVWCQILADILGHTLITPTLELPYGCIGAGILASIGVGYLGSITDSLKIFSHVDKKIYYPTSSQIYEPYYQQYLELYRCMKSDSLKMG